MKRAPPVCTGGAHRLGSSARCHFVFNEDDEALAGPESPDDAEA